MSNPITPTRSDSRALLAWCGYAALAGLTVGLVGAVIGLLAS